ncbi:TIR domain-containing protein [Psychrilyobacter atlanticus]|uniref:SLOG domain-containing protein n=1 Tax=Psychrilyobacter atlanticus TaxID=271091 RepID=UPI00042686A1|nr:TIR domain-containing protein [Psychrilyobacter atlanticus]
MIYFFKPKVSKIEDEIWEQFYEGAYEVLKNFKPQNITDINNLDNFSLEQMNSEDLLIFFNPNIKIYELEKILKAAAEENIRMFPISTSTSNRKPLDDIDEYQSFDSITEKNIRGLDDNYIKIIGECFGREIIIHEFSAIFNKKIKIFLSHRRKECEDVAKLFKDSLHDKKENVFIDLHEVSTGEKAQEIIEENLENSDILIFIQTKTTFESEFQLKELKKAFELSIPVLWITLDLKENEFKKMPLHPLGKPHFELDEITSIETNQIINYAFDMIKLKKQRLLDKIIWKLKSLKENGIDYKELCNRDSIYLIEQESLDPCFGTSIKNARLFKCLCREYQKEDLTNLKEHLLKIEKHNQNCILSIKGEERELENNINLKKYEQFLNSKTEQKFFGGVIISGSFPDNIDPKYQQNIIDAISVIVEETLIRGGKIIFGSHPTFQGLILEKSKKFNVNGEKKVKLYVSKQFEGMYDIKYFKENSEVFEIEKSIVEKIPASLTQMRKAMVSDLEAVALVCIGGKEKGDSLTLIPGIDEEINLAKEKKLPIFVISSTGGRSKELIEEGFENSLSTEDKKNEITYGNNFKLISEIILEEVAKKKDV